MVRIILSSTKCLNPLTPSYKIKEINYYFLKEFKENMKNKAILFASMGVLACTVGITALAIGGANDAFTVKADPTEYSVTFDANSTVETVGDGFYAIYGTTPRGAKVGVVGFDDSEAYFTFKGTSFMFLQLFGYDELKEVGAFEFSHITGFALSFSGGSVFFDGGDTRIDSVTSGVKYDVPLTPDNYPVFITTDSITVSSLTIWYSC